VGTIIPAEAGSARELRVHAAVGQSVRVWGDVYFHDHCSVVLETNVTVTQAPAHGTLSIRDEIVKQRRPDFGPCKDNSGMGKVVYYMRTSPGVDHFKYTSSSGVGAADRDVTVH
jgi:hypothetical protein